MRAKEKCPWRPTWQRTMLVSIYVKHAIPAWDWSEPNCISVHLIFTRPRQYHSTITQPLLIRSIADGNCFRITQTRALIRWTLQQRNYTMTSRSVGLSFLFSVICRSRFRDLVQTGSIKSSSGGGGESAFFRSNTVIWVCFALRKTGCSRNILWGNQCESAVSVCVKSKIWKCESWVLIGYC